MASLWKPFWLDDFQEQFMPCFVGHQPGASKGTIPLISPCSWLGGRIGGEYLFGIFSVFNLGVIRTVFSLGLSLCNTATTIALIYLAVFGAEPSVSDGPRLSAGLTP